MKSAKMILIVFLFVSIIVLTGCQTPMTPQGGLLVTSASYPHFQAVVDGDLGSRTGESSCVSILGLVSVGDASVERAARSSGITKIKTVDHHFLQVLGLYSQYKTIVTGE